MAYTTIKKPSDYFNTKIFTGDGSLPRAITGVGHQSDFVWLKNRDVGYQHQLYDSVRGTSAGVLYSSLSDAEDSTYQMSSFDSDGYTMGSQMGAVNGSGENIVSWSWKANGTGASNTDGSITSTVSANTTSGFSIVSYTGTGTQPSTVGHGLGVTPKMFIVKPRTDAQSWCVYHESVGAGYVTYLDVTSASGGSSVWNSTSPTSSVFTVNDNQVNSSGITYIAYCFSEVKGFSKFGSYTGNGNADGTFVYTGFKPAMVLYKNSSSVADWLIYDTKRIHSGTQLDYLEPNTSDAEGFLAVDVLSNGFKVRDASGAKFNASGDTYIYMAFAEEPLVGDNPATAR
jgi:hypothetical protein